MEQLPVVLREEAVADLFEIYAFVLEQSGHPEQAWRFIERMRARCERIGHAPRGGRARDDLMPGLMTVPFEHSAVVAYILDADLVRVTNIFYGRRDYEALYGKVTRED